MRPSAKKQRLYLNRPVWSFDLEHRTSLRPFGGSVIGPTAEIQQRGVRQYFLWPSRNTLTSETAYVLYVTIVPASGMCTHEGADGSSGVDYRTLTQEQAIKWGIDWSKTYVRNRSWFLPRISVCGSCRTWKLKPCRTERRRPQVLSRLGVARGRTRSNIVLCAAHSPLAGQIR